MCSCRFVGACCAGQYSSAAQVACCCCCDDASCVIQWQELRAVALATCAVPTTTTHHYKRTLIQHALCSQTKHARHTRAAALAQLHCAGLHAGSCRRSLKTRTGCQCQHQYAPTPCCHASVTHISTGQHASVNGLVDDQLPIDGAQVLTIAGTPRHPQPYCIQVHQFQQRS